MQEARGERLKNRSPRGQGAEMSREILLLVDALAREKNVEKDTVFGALELALASASKKRFNEDVDIRAHVDRTTGDFSFFRRWQIVPDEEFEVPSRQYMLRDARDAGEDAKMGEAVREPRV